MKLHELKTILAGHPAAQIRFQLPSGEFAPAHSHVTEVARIAKRFVDCGGTLRTDTLCRLQTWSADDTDHRLTAGKLAKIFAKAESVLLTDDLDVDIEHEVGVITQFPLGSVTVGDKELIFQLTERHTACLAMDKCLPPANAGSGFDLRKHDFREPAGNGKSGRKCC